MLNGQTIPAGFTATTSALSQPEGGVSAAVRLAHHCRRSGQRNRKGHCRYLRRRDAELGHARLSCWGRWRCRCRPGRKGFIHLSERRRLGGHLRCRHWFMDTIALSQPRQGTAATALGNKPFTLEASGRRSRPQRCEPANPTDVAAAPLRMPETSVVLTNSGDADLTGPYTVQVYAIPPGQYHNAVLVGSQAVNGTLAASDSCSSPSPSISPPPPPAPITSSPWSKPPTAPSPPSPAPPKTSPSANPPPLNRPLNPPPRSARPSTPPRPPNRTLPIPGSRPAMRCCDDLRPHRRAGDLASGGSTRKLHSFHQRSVYLRRRIDHRHLQPGRARLDRRGFRVERIECYHRAEFHRPVVDVDRTRCWRWIGGILGPRHPRLSGTADFRFGLDLGR